MPALVLFGRRWRIGSDDLPIPTLIYILIHIPAILSLSLLQLFSRYNDPGDLIPSLLRNFL